MFARREKFAGESLARCRIGFPVQFHMELELFQFLATGKVFEGVGVEPNVIAYLGEGVVQWRALVVAQGGIAQDFHEQRNDRVFFSKLPRLDNATQGIDVARVKIKDLFKGKGCLKLLMDQHPWRSLALLYACFTGFFLFASGIIAGYWQNKIQYGCIKERLKKHPALKISMSPRRLDKLANYTEKNFGALIGNIALGFFLGFAGIMGKILGIPFDIRHITISAGNTAIGIYGMGIDNIPPYFLLAVVFGVLGIGLLNFLVSFSLAFLVAVKSRGIRFAQYPKLLRTVMNYFWKHPRQYILPSKKMAEQTYKPLSS